MKILTIIPISIIALFSFCGIGMSFWDQVIINTVLL